MTEDRRILDQRYFHAFAVLAPNSLRLEHFWTSLTDVHSHSGLTTKSTGIHLRVLRSETFYGRGDALPLQPSRDGFYDYDIFGIEGTLPILGQTLILGFPFLALGREIARKIQERGHFREVEFFQIRLNDLVKHVRSASVPVISIPRVKIRIDGDPNLTGVSIAGKYAVFSEVYDLVSSTEGMTRLVERCILRYDGGEQGTLSAHCDNQGNFKLWIQSGFRNLPCIMPFLSALQQTGATTADASLPLRRAAESDESDEG